MDVLLVDVLLVDMLLVDMLLVEVSADVVEGVVGLATMCFSGVDVVGAGGAVTWSCSSALSLIKKSP